MRKLNQTELNYIFNAEDKDAIIILESILDSRKSASSYNDVINHDLKDKNATVLKIKKAIAGNGLDSKECIEKANREILKILLQQKVEHRGHISDAIVKDDVAIVDIEGVLDGSNEVIAAPHTDYLTDMEYQAFMCISDQAIDTSAIDDLPDKTKRYYMRMAAAKMRIVRHL